LSHILSLLRSVVFIVSFLTFPNNEALGLVVKKHYNWLFSTVSFLSQFGFTTVTLSNFGLARLIVCIGLIEVFDVALLRFQYVFYIPIPPVWTTMCRVREHSAAKETVCYYHRQGSDLFFSARWKLRNQMQN